MREKATNLYSVLDSELERMHRLMHQQMSLPPDRHYAGGGVNPPMSTLYRRILEMQDLLLKAVISSDKELQDKVAEFAFMGSQGDSDESSMYKK